MASTYPPTERSRPAEQLSIGLGLVGVGLAVGLTWIGVRTAQRVMHDTRSREQDSTDSPGMIRIEKAITVNRTVEEVYRFWRQLENLPRFMYHLESVHEIDDRRSHWRAKAPAGRSVEWDAEILTDRANEWIAWRSIPGSDIDNSGSVRFAAAPGGRGAEVRVQLQYNPPAGRLGRIIAKLFGEEPEQQITDDLRRFKQLLEAGEIPVSDGPGLRRAAQPARHVDRLKALAGVH